MLTKDLRTTPFPQNDPWDTPTNGLARATRWLQIVLSRSSLLGPVDPSFRALSGRLTFTVRRDKFHKDSLPHGRWVLVLTDHSQVDSLGVWYRSVNFGAETRADSPDSLRILVYLVIHDSG